MAISVRPAGRSDLDALVAFTLAEAREAEALTLDANTVRRGVGAALDDPEVARYWLAESDGEPAGSVSIVREWSDWRAGWYWWIQGFYLRPEARGHGLADRLVRAVLDAARAEGTLELRLYVSAGNARARRAYARMGFRDTPYRIMLVKC